MRKFSIVMVAVFALSAALLAQQSTPATDKAEIFAGYTYENAGLKNAGLDRQNLNGANLAGTAFLNRNLGITADITGAWGSDVSGSGVNVARYTYLFGPTVKAATRSPFTPYAHVLFGVDHERFSNFGEDYSHNAFAVAAGGGVDVKLASHLSARLAQVDYIHTTHDQGEDHLRFSTGLVWKY